ncbi:MAG: nucleotidyltransferase domain-containing protein [Phycisphaerae bacterium]
MFRWPDRETVLAAARHWAATLRTREPAVRVVMCIGSYARGNWGVGSDLDVIVILEESNLSPTERYARYYPDGLPVPADLWVYTRAEWEAMAACSPRLWERIQREMVAL